MTQGEDGNPKGGTRADQIKRQAEERQRRQAEALRANLRRRKEQTRGRADDAAPSGGAEPAPAKEDPPAR